MTISKKIIKVNGIHGDFWSFENDLITNQIIEFGAHTRNEIALVFDQIAPEGICVDIGAHIGTFTIPMAKKIGPSGKVLSIEGSAETASLLVKNIALNNLIGNVDYVHGIAADGRSRTLARQEWVGNSGGGHYLQSEKSDPHDTVDCAALLLEKGFEAPNLIKIDVEGMEAIVLRNLETIIKEALPVLYVEISSEQLARFGDDPISIELQLRNLGYRFYRNKGPRNSTTDMYDLEEIETLAGGKTLFDMLALPPSV